MKFSIKSTAYIQFMGSVGENTLINFSLSLTAFGVSPEEFDPCTYIKSIVF
jgi:hypothetical protein